MTALRVMDEYDALSSIAKKDLALKDFFVFPLIGYSYEIEVDPKSKFLKRSDGRTLYWSLRVNFKTETIKYRESVGRSVVDIAVMGNETLVLGKMLASQIRALMEKHYNEDVIHIMFRRVTLRTSIVKVLPLSN